MKHKFFVKRRSPRAAEPLEKSTENTDTKAQHRHTFLPLYQQAESFNGDTEKQSKNRAEQWTEPGNQ